MNILVIDNDSLGQDDVISIFLNMGHKVFKYRHNDIQMHDNDEIYRELSALIVEQNISLFFSINYYPIISYVLKDTEVKYISYVYDSPYISLYTCSIIFPCNYIFIFDYAVYEELKNGGITTVYYLPVSVNICRKNKILDNNINKFNETKYENIDISFTGGLNNKEQNLYNRLSEKLEGKYDYVRGYLDSMILAQSKIYGCFFLDKMLDDDILKILSYVYPYERHSDSIVGLDYIYAHLFLAEKTSEIERQYLLQKVSVDYSLSLFGYNKSSEIPKAYDFGKVAYENMPIIFNKSKINLNISLRNTLTGIPHKCIDIMGCGGFLLTNYQADFLRHFEAGVHFDYYIDENDLMHKIEYYMNHEDERMTIAENGRKLIAKKHNLEDYLKEMIEFVMQSK